MVTYFSDGQGPVALLSEIAVKQLSAHCARPFLKRFITHMIIEAERGRIHSGHETCPRRPAQRKITVCAREGDASGGQPVHIGGFGVGVTFGVCGKVIQVIDGYKQYIRFISRISQSRNQDQRNVKEPAVHAKYPQADF